MIGGGALGPQASNAVRHVAAQNGVWSLGNFGGVPPKSAMTYYPGTEEAAPDAATSQAPDSPIAASVQEHDYRFIFNSSPVGMVSGSLLASCFDPSQAFSNHILCSTGYCINGRSIRRLQLAILPAVQLHQARIVLDDHFQLDKSARSTERV